MYGPPQDGMRRFGVPQMPPNGNTGVAGPHGMPQPMPQPGGGMGMPRVPMQMPQGPMGGQRFPGPTFTGPNGAAQAQGGFRALLMRLLASGGA